MVNPRNRLFEMLSPGDLILLPYTSDLTPAGIAFACQTLPYLDCRDTSETFQILRQIVAQQSAELAFRRHLTSQHVPHKLSYDRLFARPGQVSAVIGGRHCSLYCSTIHRREKIREILQDPARLLAFPAVLPSADLFMENRSETDLLVFAFVPGLITATRAETDKAISAGQTVQLVYPLPPAWSQPSRWGSLGRIVLKSESDSQLTLTLGGNTEDRSFILEEVDLPPLQRVQAGKNYYSLAFLQVSEIPSRRLGLHCPGLDKTLLIQPGQWGNVWVYGMNVVLAGWMTRGEFRLSARPCHTDQDTYHPGSDGKYLAVQVDQLHPLQDLFARASSWG